jgi:hypothetical protein
MLDRMYSDLAPTAPLELTLVGESLVIQGTVRSRFRRLTDLLNDKDSVHVVLTNATFADIESGRVVAQAAAAQVATESILFAHTSSLTVSDEELRQPRRGVRATLLLPPFTVEGLVHLPYESELGMALEAYEGRFLPVTQARYWLSDGADEPQDVDLVLVNHARTHVAVAPDVEWKTDFTTEPSEQAPKPW